ncbi:MAG TPA: transposase [Chthonomonadaceae bacterium]|nr:transposase [Chthonomonadaceae bacterium]
MKLVLKIKLLVDEQTEQALKQTLAAYHSACCYLSDYAFHNHVFSRHNLQKACYYEVKHRFSLPAQLVIRAIAEVSSAYKAHRVLVQEHNRNNPSEDRRDLAHIVFRPDLAVVYDERVLSYTRNEQNLSLTTVCGRIKLAFQVGEKRKALLPYIKGQADLKRYGKKWFLLQTLEVPEGHEQEPQNCLGVDLGIRTLASWHDGKKNHRHYGNHARAVRKHYSSVRRSLQHRNTKSSRRRVKAIGQKEARTIRNINHQLSRRIVEHAQRTNSQIVLEDLSSLKDRAKDRVFKSLRYEQMSWTYGQLQAFILYKSRLAGVKVIFVPSAYTSKTCSQCFYCSDQNRYGTWFTCQGCGSCCHADENAAINIRFLGAESTRQKRVVGMQDFLHTDGREPLALALR